jgi:hypothetical protein
VLDRSIAGFQAQIAAERERSAGRADSLAPKLSVYDRLLIDQNIAGTALNAAETSLEGARLDATRKQLYLERVVNPDHPGGLRGDIPAGCGPAGTSPGIAVSRVAPIVRGLIERLRREGKTQTLSENLSFDCPGGRLARLGRDGAQGSIAVAPPPVVMVRSEIAMRGFRRASRSDRSSNETT